MSETTVIAGVGPGLGESIARTFADRGCQIGLLARSEGYLDALADDLPTPAVGVPTDVADEADVERAFAAVRDELGPVEVLINHASAGAWRGLESISVDEFDRALAVGPRGGLLCSKHAVEDMLAGDGGTVVFTGATSAVRGRGGAIGFSAAKFAVRGMAESMARELGPRGIHVAHVVIDGQIRGPAHREEHPGRGEETFLDPDAIAETYWHLVEQDRSAWTLELDVRPHVEEF